MELHAAKNRDAEIADFTHAIGLLARRVRAAAALQELSWTEAAVLSRLANDGPATTAGLARAEAVKPQSMGATVAALEEKGLVERKPHPTDGRQANIALTAKGRPCGRAPRMRSGPGWRRPLPNSTAGSRPLSSAAEMVKRLVEYEPARSARAAPVPFHTPGERCGAAISSSTSPARASL